MDNIIGQPSTGYNYINMAVSSSSTLQHMHTILSYMIIIFISIISLCMHIFYLVMCTILLISSYYICICIYIIQHKIFAYIFVYNIQYKQMDNTYVHPVTGPAGTDQISIQLYSKHKLTQDVKAQLSHHFTHKLPKAKGNKMLLIGSKVGITARLMQPYCTQIDIVAEEQYIPILQALFIKGQSVEYVFNREGFIGDKHIVPVKKNPDCKVNVIEISTFKNYVPRDSHYDIILLQNVIVHPKINILKQLMRLRHDVLITMIVPGKLVHKNMFQLLSGIEQNILHVFYNQATHERTEYLRQITGRRQEINLWEVFVWIKKNTEDVRKELAKVEKILQEEVGKFTVYNDVRVANNQGPSAYESQSSLSQYIDLHYGETEYFGVKNFPAQCAQKTIEAAKTENIQGRVLDVGCAVGRSTIELAQYFNEAVGLEYSQLFVTNAEKILHEKYKQLSGKVKFVKGDACKLDKNLGKFDAVYAGNLIDRLYQPQAFIRTVASMMNDKSLLVLASPYTWLQQYTKVQNWLGGKKINGKDVTTHERLVQLLGELGFKQLRAPEDVRFVIAENPWVYQYTASQMTYWIKILK